jgi:hypothetical protein
MSQPRSTPRGQKVASSTTVGSTVVASTAVTGSTVSTPKKPVARVRGGAATTGISKIAPTEPVPDMPPAPVEPVQPMVQPIVQQPPRAGCTLLELVTYMNTVYAAWTFFIPPKGINDIIGCKRAAASPHVCQKWTFIQVGSDDDRRRIGEIRSSFVQNAFSNRAVPCYLTHAATLVFTDANTGSKLRL